MSIKPVMYFIISFTLSFSIFFFKIIKFQPITLGELLTFISSIILLIITWKSVSNAKDANKLTESSMKIAQDSLDLQINQFNYNISSDLIFYIDKVKFVPFKFDYENDMSERFYENHLFKIENASTNICYNISVKTCVYMEDKCWEDYYDYVKKMIVSLNEKDEKLEKYYSKLENEVDFSGSEPFNPMPTSRNYYKNRIHTLESKPNIVSRKEQQYLNAENELKTSIPFHFFNFLMLFYNNIIPAPKLYIFIKYNDKMNNFYEECYEFEVVIKKNDMATHQIELKKVPVNNIYIKNVKEKLYQQKRLLDDLKKEN